MAAEPVDEPILRVNCNQTALVLGGSVASAVPPDLLIDDSKVFMPLQGDVVKILASVLAPPLCPSVLSSKFRVAVLLYGLTGCGKRTVVRYVARRLGLHVVEYSCHNLMTSSERKTSAALASAFSMANSCSMGRHSWNIRTQRAANWNLQFFNFCCEFSLFLGHQHHLQGPKPTVSD